MTKRMYAAIIRNGGEDGYWAEFPDLPGCYGYGDTLMECVESASDALETHLAAMEDSGMAFPDAGDPVSDDGKVAWFYADTSTVDLSGPSMTAADAARELGVTPARVSQLIADGRLDAKRVGSMTLVTDESVKSYADTPRTPGRPKKEFASA